MPYLTREHLTYDGRKLVRYVRSSEAKHALAVAGIALPENPVSVESQLPTSSRLPKGIIDGREVRVSKRGAYGRKGMRAPAERVSSRDNRVPEWALRRLDTVGVATHPDASSADYDLLLREIRQYPKQASLRLYADSSDVIGSIVSIDAYLPEREQERAKDHAPASPAVTSAAVLPDVVRYASSVGYIGNVL